jgi:hypothetical protein
MINRESDSVKKHGIKSVTLFEALEKAHKIERTRLFYIPRHFFRCQVERLFQRLTHD